MKRARVSTLVVAALAFAGTATAQRPAAPPSAATAAVVVDDGYILALGAADAFLHAWATRDVAGAKAVLTPAALKRYSSDDFATLIQGTSSPHHESYEIGPGKKVSATKYSFDVIEYEYLTGMNAHDPRPKPSQIVIVQAGPDKWLVDAFPVS